MGNSIKWAVVFLSCIGFTLGGAFSVEAATSGSHYPLGVEGVMAATVPPPGFHYRIYNTWYNPTKRKDDNGDKMSGDFDLDVFATAHRFIHVTNKQILGADFFYNAIVPLVDKDISMDTPGGSISDSKSLSLGDVTFEPFGLAWHKARWDATVALAVIAPTGEYDADKPASPGLGYWSGVLTLGGTFYFDNEKSWTISALTRTLVHTEQDDTDVRPGSEFLVEYGLGKQFMVNEKLSVRPGIAGYAYWQIEDDSDDGPGTVADERKKSFALGAEINFFWLPPTLFQMNLRALREFEAENTTQGSQVILTITKSW